MRLEPGGRAEAVIEGWRQAELAIVIVCLWGTHWAVFNQCHATRHAPRCADSDPQPLPPGPGSALESTIKHAGYLCRSRLSKAAALDPRCQQLPVLASVPPRRRQQSPTKRATERHAACFRDVAAAL